MREKLRLLLIIIYIIGIPVAYYDCKKTIILINEKYDYGQPKFSKGNQLMSITLSLGSWIAICSSRLYRMVDKWDDIKTN